MTAETYAPPITHLDVSSTSLEHIRAAVVELQEYVRTREPEQAGDALDKVITWRDAVSAGLAKYSLGTFGQSGPGGGGSFEPPPPSGLSGWDDLTPPDQLENLLVTSMPTGFFVEFDAPVYGQGGGNAYSIIYQANYSGSGPLPTFSASVEVGRITERGVILVIAAEPGTQGHFWAQPVSFAEDYNRVPPQATPTGGTNGVSATAGLIDGAQHIEALSVGTAQIANLAVTDGKMVSLSVAKLTAGSIGVSEYIQSTGFVSGSAGWRINGNGNSEFNNIVARGTIYASAGLIGGASIGSTYVQSTNYVANTSGWKLDNATGKLYAIDVVLGDGTATKLNDAAVNTGQHVFAVGTPESECTISAVSTSYAVTGKRVTFRGQVHVTFDFAVPAGVHHIAVNVDARIDGYATYPATGGNPQGASLFTCQTFLNLPSVPGNYNGNNFVVPFTYTGSPAAGTSSFTIDVKIKFRDNTGAATTISLNGFAYAFAVYTVVENLA